MQDRQDRGFREEGYITRHNEEIDLSDWSSPLGILKVIEDFMNALLFVNTKDLKKSLESPKITKISRPKKE